MSRSPAEGGHAVLEGSRHVRLVKPRGSRHKPGGSRHPAKRSRLRLLGVQKVSGDARHLKNYESRNFFN